MIEVLNKKASTAILDNLHNVVADVISTELKRQQLGIITDLTGEEKDVEAVGVDVKLLSVAIKFLKDNDVTAEILESDKIRSLSENIKEIANKENDFKEISVDDMIAFKGDI